eukprot:PhM_4_TR12275/c0_g1_i2/m.105537/K03439/trmB, METTL1; tRNA (guanine-N7-)-methyltransferase
MSNDMTIQRYSSATVEPLKWTRFPIRARPHRNPLSDNDDTHPECPEAVPWSEKYPTFSNFSGVQFLDVGSAYGGMLCRMGQLYPETTMLGLEIRTKVAEFAQSRVLEAREKNSQLHNVWFEQCNVMRYLPYWFGKAQLQKMFFCYPDPHWKKKNLRRRIMGPTLVAEYAYVLAPGGRLYTVSDVADLEEWMVAQLDACPLFRRLPQSEVDADPLTDIVMNSSEDAVRTEKRGDKKNCAIHIRL